MRYLLLIYEEPSADAADRGRAGDAMMAEYATYSAWLRETGQLLGGEALQDVVERHDGRGPRRSADRHRRPVRRDQGAPRRVLPDRGDGPRRGDRGGRADPGRDASARSRSARSWRWADGGRARGDGRSAEDVPGPGRRRRPRLPRGARAGVATLIRVLGDFDLAEEAVADAYVAALERWPVDGVPANPGAWITTTARNRAIDRAGARRIADAQDRRARPRRGVRRGGASGERSWRRRRTRWPRSPTTSCG